MKSIIPIIALLFYSHILFSWGANGHRIIAQICDLHLSSDSKTELENILGKNYLAEIANWPDYIRSEDEWDFAEKWHYTTIHPHQTVKLVRKQYKEDPPINDAIEAMEMMKDILKDDAEATAFLENLMEKNGAKPLNNSTKATALAFLVHLVGDIHQPLHVGKNKDRGGNKISVLFFLEKTNLHAVWDTKIIEHERLSYTEFAHFINKLTTQEIAKYQEDSIDDWASESIALREHIYNTLYNFTDRVTGLPSFSWQYQHDNINRVKERLVQGGVRLAGVLDSIFES